MKTKTKGCSHMPVFYQPGQGEFVIRGLVYHDDRPDHKDVVVRIRDAAAANYGFVSTGRWLDVEVSADGELLDFYPRCFKLKGQFPVELEVGFLEGELFENGEEIAVVHNKDPQYRVN